MLSIGPTGTGKTLTIADKLTKAMPKDFIPDFIVFSAKTSSNQTQDLIDSKLDKRRKGVRHACALACVCVMCVGEHELFLNEYACERA